MSTVFDFRNLRLPKLSRASIIIGSLAICTVLYILYSMVLTGVVNYKDLNVAAPLAFAYCTLVATPAGLALVCVNW